MSHAARADHVLINDLLALTATPETSALKALNFLLEPGNSGNLVFLDAINECVPGLLNLTSPAFVSRQTAFRRGTVVLLPFANFISPTWVAPDGLLDALENFIPVLFSVGAQFLGAQDAGSMSLSKDCRRLLDMVKRTQSVVGARGANTKAILDGMGIESIVIGCPSMHVGIPRWRTGANAARPKVCTNNNFSGELRLIASRLNGFSYKHASGFVCQNEEGVILDIMGVPEEAADFVASQSLNEQQARLLRNRVFSYGFYNDGSCTWAALRQWFISNARLFFSMENWRRYVGAFDLSVGTRFHGNVVALQAGTPAVFVPPDARVQELVDFYELPHITPAQFMQVESPTDLLAQASIGPHLERMPSCRRNFAMFLEAYFPQRRIRKF